MATLEETQNERKKYFIILITVAIILSIVAAFIGFRLTQDQPTTPNPGAAAGCTYANTQARIQKDATVAWGPSLTINAGESFRVGSFHDGTGLFATDTNIKVTGPDGAAVLNCQATAVDGACNGKTVTQTTTAGTYTVVVTTPGQEGAACTDTATVTVQSSGPAACPYENTQARVQKDATVAWTNSITINEGGTFRIGSFHDGTGQFADDTRLRVNAPDGTKIVDCEGTSNDGACNGKTVTADQAGTYTIRVTTPEFSGSECGENASVLAASTSGNTPPPAPITDELPRTAIVGESTDKILGGVILVLIGLFVLRYAYVLRKNS